MKKGSDAAPLRDVYAVVWESVSDVIDVFLSDLCFSVNDGGQSHGKVCCDFSVFHPAHEAVKYILLNIGELHSFYDGIDIVIRFFLLYVERHRNVSIGLRSFKNFRVTLVAAYGTQVAVDFSIAVVFDGIKQECIIS